MIFMSQSGITDAAREGDWDLWYHRHLEIMATVPGISSAQRFKTATPGYPPSLAMYSVASADVFNDPYYLSVRGMGEWLPFIDRRYYRRNLFEGRERAPEVGDSELLLIADRDERDPNLTGAWQWLACAGIDHSTRVRALSIVAAGTSSLVADGFAVYRPASACYKPRP